MVIYETFIHPHFRDTGECEYIARIVFKDRFRFIENHWDHLGVKGLYIIDHSRLV